MSDKGDVFRESASSIKIRVSYSSFDRRLLFVTASPLYSYRIRGLVIPNGGAAVRLPLRL